VSTRVPGSVRRIAVGLFVPVLLALLVRATIVQAYHIPSGSMENTLLPGDFVLAEKVSFGPLVPGRLPGITAALPSLRVPALRHPHPGEIVIFQHPENPDIDLIKRCIAVAGQIVEIRDKEVLVDGEPAWGPPGLKHSDRRMLTNQRDNFGPFEVPPGHIFVMGDNRDNSFDSRFFGAVPLDNLRARPLLIYFSWNGDGGPLRKIRWTHLGIVR
jgi:signal peptidase I